MTEKLLRVTAPHFCAGIVLDEAGKVIAAAPILGWARGKSEIEIVNYARRRGWKIESLFNSALLS